jgi:UDP-glucose 4-epimerase
MKVLVTGGAGFIASHVVDGYKAAGLDVAVVDDLSRGSRENLRPDTPFYQADIRDREALRAIFEKEKPEIVNHHAAQMDVRRAVREPIFDAECNILGSIHLLDLSVEYKVRRFIYVSSGGAVYGEPKALPATELTPVRPLAPYGISKHTIEHYLFTYNHIYGSPAYVVLRYGNVYGPRQSSKGEAGVVAIFCEQILRNETPTIYGDGSKTRDYVSVSDLVRANVKALERGDGEIFNIASGKPTTDYEIFAAVRDALGKGPLEPHFAPRRPEEVDHIYLDVTKAREGLDWQPEIDLKEGIRQTAEWFRKRLG